MYKPYKIGLKNTNLSIKEKIYGLSYFYFMLIALTAGVGAMMLYSAANGDWDVWATKHLVRFGVAFSAMFVVSMIDIKFYLRYAYLFYFATLILLIIVEVAGYTGMGATRWIDLKFFKLQPSELMKIALVLALAKYFNNATLQKIESIRGILPAVLMSLVPIAFIMMQPDLGTSLMLLAVLVVTLFVAGVQIWKFVTVGVLGLVTMPIIWSFLHNYQKQRVLTFLNPESDPLGAGYHIMQSKIALGSGGFWGKGLLKGTQSHLNFLPEKHTDFIFTMLSEEFGFVGAVLLILLNLMILICSYSFAMKVTSYFGKMVIIGLATNYFLYVFINMAMVLGLLPVVGVPLPLVSYGGTAMMSVMVSFGLIMAMHINAETNLGKE